MKKIFLDTGLFIALLHGDDIHHKLASTVLIKHIKAGNSLITSDYILDETITWLRCKQKWPITTVSSFMRDIYASDLTIVDVTQDIFRLALQKMKTFNDHHFSTTDCTSFAIMDIMKINDVLSSDKDFTIAGFNNLLLQ